ncbi:MAG: hypothetical protein KKF46_02535 [Nanoarchaeota archaeon]|nr:hypothetical protein [Nanoarchaeota archaeon]MBU1321210.1 hypothetical protein [Nanoarchaeota archaeon]MBU1597015.1 hypothetical protein [Nanoarchaeota archaeon]MBU2441839.1 hypothetical protein [Nanoarchaeota archaeon]
MGKKIKNLVMSGIAALFLLQATPAPSSVVASAPEKIVYSIKKEDLEKKFYWSFEKCHKSSNFDDLKGKGAEKFKKNLEDLLGFSDYKGILNYANEFNVILEHVHTVINYHLAEGVGKAHEVPTEIRRLGNAETYRRIPTIETSDYKLDLSINNDGVNVIEIRFEDKDIEYTLDIRFLDENSFNNRERIIQKSSSVGTPVIWRHTDSSMIMGSDGKYNFNGKPIQEFQFSDFESEKNPDGFVMTGYVPVFENFDLKKYNDLYLKLIDKLLYESIIPNL